MQSEKHVEQVKINLGSYWRPYSNRVNFSLLRVQPPIGSSFAVNFVLRKLKVHT